jgi:hypothetical protein
VLGEAAVREAGVFEPAAVRRVLDDHFARRANYDNQIWGLLSFMLWHREYIEGEALAEPREPREPRAAAVGGA